MCFCSCLSRFWRPSCGSGCGGVLFWFLNPPSPRAVEEQISGLHTTLTARRTGSDQHTNGTYQPPIVFKKHHSFKQIVQKHVQFFSSNAHFLKQHTNFFNKNNAIVQKTFFGLVLPVGILIAS